MMISALCCAVILHAQNNIHSPYSRFGLGNLDQPGSVGHFSMGGLTTPLADQYVINWNNPASYSFLDVTTLQVSGKGTSSQYASATSENSFRGGQIAEAFMAFRKSGSKWGYAFGMTPFSTVGYGFSTKSAINDTLSAVYSYRGTGGINRATIGVSRVFHYRKPVFDSEGNKRTDTLSVKLHEISFGTNANFIFGNIIDTSKIQYSNINIYNTRVTEKNRITGFLFDLGATYRVPLKLTFDDKRISGGTYLQAGIRYTFETDLNSKISSLNQLYVRSGGVEFGIDSVAYSSGISQKITMPQSIAAGIAIRKTGKNIGSFQVGVDYKIQDWKSTSAILRSELDQNRLLDRYSSIALGIEYKPSQASSSNLPHRLTYRMGVRTTDTYLKLNGNVIQQRAVSFGLAIPVLKSESKLHLGVEYGEGGLMTDGLVREQFWNFQIGFTLTPRELWFNQIKYD